ncbi:sirohydrochlorin chelatase [Nocardioides sp. SYSU DS0651]|uniref:sirohydrochlorin chelatase n=1 Tax=Nocardioides sp. SYSU DS0651 TaxID=3415955 RepID=UPI003F4C72E8
MTRLVTVAHGTRTPVGNEVAVELTAAAGEILGLDHVASYVELSEPLFADVVAEPYDGPTVVVPLLLSTGYHIKHDLPAAIAAAGAADRVHLAGPFGPHPLLAEAQADRLREAGARPGQPVVMVAAGSSDPDALTDLDGAVALLAEAWGAPVRLATLSAIGSRPADVVQPGDAVSPYLLATGFFHRRLAEEARTAGATVVADVIGPHRDVVGLVVERASRAQALG